MVSEIMKKFNKDKYLKQLEFKRFYRKYERYFYIGIPCLLVSILGIYFAYSKFFVASEEEVVRTTVGEFIYGDIIMTPYVDGQYSSTFPEKKTGINVEKVICDGDVCASWDEDKWGLYVTNLNKRTKCSVYFVTPNSCGINDNVSCINSREGLATLANEVNNGDNKSGKIIYLTSDLDLGGKFDSDGNTLDGNISWTPIGTKINPFSGTFDGNGHIISNMYINDSEKSGLFNYLYNGKMLNLGIENSYVKSLSGYASGIVSQLWYSKIINCYNAATINGKKSGAGISSGILESEIKNCYNKGNINSNGEQFAAGIVGYHMGNALINCYNIGSIIGGSEAGGIVGGSQDVVRNTYNLGNISGSATGGIIGQLYDPSGAAVYNSYNISKASGGIVGDVYQNQNRFKLSENYYLKGTADYGLYSLKSNQGAEPLSQQDMPSVISVINGDNAFVEDTNNINNGYPILKWQAERENN